MALAATLRCTDSWVAIAAFAIDDKTSRRSHQRSKGLAALHRGSAWATANRVVLGQVSAEAKSNEITAIPRLLQWLILKGCIVTTGCQTKIAEHMTKLGIKNKREQRALLRAKFGAGKNAHGSPEQEAVASSGD